MAFKASDTTYSYLRQGETGPERNIPLITALFSSSLGTKAGFRRSSDIHDCAGTDATSQHLLVFFCSGVQDRRL